MPLFLVQRRESIKLLRRKKLNVEPRTIEVFLEAAAKVDCSWVCVVDTYPPKTTLLFWVGAWGTRECNRSDGLEPEGSIMHV